MKFNKWTLGLAAVGAVSLTSAVRADEAKLSQVQTALSNTTLSGFVDTSAQWNLGTQNYKNASGAGLVTPPYGNGVKSDGFTLNSVDIALDKPEDESPWASGYHVEFQQGADWGGIRQAYVVVRTPVGNGIDWKMGFFDTVVGYESNSDPLNPNFTRSYGYAIEPTSHTGVVATYKVSSLLTLSAGVVDSSNVGAFGQGSFNATTASGIGSKYESQKTYLGTIALTAPDSWGWAKGSTLNLAVIHSLDSATATGTRDNYFAGLSLPTPWSTVKVGAAFDYVHSGAHVIPAGPTANNQYSWDAALYATFQPTDKLSFNARAEYLDDGANILGLYAGGVYPSFNQYSKVEEVTLTVQYNLWANVISRAEFRWDHSDTGTPYGVNPGATGNPDVANAYLLAFNLIYQF